MEITNEVKQRIVAAIAADRENYPSDNRHATALGIAPSVYNAIKRATAYGNALAGSPDPDLRVCEQAAGSVPGKRFERHPVRYAQYRQDLYSESLCEAAQARRVCGLQPGEDQAEADTLHCQGIRRDQQRTLQRRV